MSVKDNATGAGAGSYAGMSYEELLANPPTNVRRKQPLPAAKPQSTAILVAYHHGLRASEIVALRWDDVDLTTGPFCSQPSPHPTKTHQRPSLKSARGHAAAAL